MAVLRAVLVGCGSMGSNWAGILAPRPDIDIAGLVDVVPAASAALAARNGLDGHAGCLDEMVTALVNGERPMTHSGDNAKSLGMVLAAIESAGTGERVPLRL